jgi:ABC-type glycerol-3-phosphate transport system substrate-binding protein
VTAEQSGAIPVISGALNAKYLQDPVYKAPTDLAKREQVFIHPPDYLPEYASWNINTWPQEIQKVLLGQQTPQQAVDNLVPPLEQAYAKFKAG